MILLAENRFFQAGKGAENTKEKSKNCFTCKVTPKDWEFPK
jgi:predicted adenine nucleotide alpha hydrolase (AANH) superfamily ATPase